ncbi:hypothetical protein [Gordonia hongkongensis]|uniref:hypothetical protein n=1 Tax=Gordonia hongkongensis TaxID=1701090 RepID=UPI003D72991B
MIDPDTDTPDVETHDSPAVAPEVTPDDPDHHLEPPAEEPAEEPDADPEPRSAEAKRYRLRLRETEGELKTVRDQLDATRQTIIDNACATASLDRRLWDAAGVDLTELTLDNGSLDLKAIQDRARQVRFEMVGGVRPNPQQGTYGSSATAGTWSQVIQNARKNNT